jgi:hypothetical protein
MHDLVKKLDTYRLEIVAILAAVANFATSIDIDNPYSRGNWKTLTLLFFFSAIVVSIAAIRKNLDELKGSISAASLFIKNVARAGNEEALLEYVLRIGTFQVVDTQFWVAYAQELKHTDSAATIEKIKKVLGAIDTNTITIHPEAVYRLMHRLLMIVIENDETYYGTATISELQNADDNAKKFLLELPKTYPGDIVRIIFVDNEEQLLGLNDETRAALKAQLDANVRLFIDSTTKPSDRLNFGVYGSVAVGKYDEASGSNMLIFDKEIVAKHRTRFSELTKDFGTAKKLQPKHLNRIAPE